MSRLRPLLLCCLLLTLPTHGADHHGPDANRIERLDVTLTTLIQALEHVGGETPDADTRRVLENTRLQRQKGLALAADEHYAQAGALLNDALTEIKLKIAELRNNTYREEQADGNADHLTKKRQKDLKHIDESLTALEDALVRIGEEKGRSSLVAEIHTQIEQHRQSARDLVERGALEAARGELDQALITVKTAIATLRNRETLVRSLDFASKEEEYRYELDRYETYAMLIQLLAKKSSQTDSVQTQMTAFQRDAQAQEERARAAANAGDFEAAVKFQEISNSHLLKAIRRGGIYVPG